jgi:predicted RND superfamily exporter protein
MIERIARHLESLLFGHRRAVLVFFAVVTLFLGYEVTGLHIDAGFEKLLPLDHAYIQTFLEHRDEFGGADRLLIAVRAKHGDIFTPEFFDTLQKVTDAVFFLPGVNRSTVTSIFTPNVRFIEIVEGGFTGGNVIPADFEPTPDMLARVRENILKSGTVGRLVANDFTAAMVTAQLVEFDPATGEKLDYLEVADLLERQIRDVYVSDDIDIHIIGFAKIMGDIADGAAGVILFFGVAFLVTAILVYAFIHSARLMVLPLVCATLSVLWTLGLLTLFGYGLDPMSLLVPFLIFAIGVSHGVQMINAVGAEVFDGADSLTAARLSFRRLLAPGAAALISDTVGFLTLLLIDIRIIQELAITASLGVIVIIFSNLVLLPVLLSYPRFDQKYRDKLHRSAQHRERLWRALARFTQPRWAMAGLLVAAALGAWATFESRHIEIGDIHAGVPELRPDARYNQDSAVISEHFSIGLDILTAIVETIPDGCVEYDIMTTIDQFQWEIQNVEGVQSAISLPSVAKIVNAGWNEGNPKWRVLPRNPATLSQAVTPVETSTGLLNSDCSVMPVIFFLEDHRAETIDRVVKAVKAYAREHDSDRHRFRLATGNVGVMAATNEVVKAAQVNMLLYIYVAVILLALLTFRSWRATVCIVLPLSLVSVLSYALMSLLGIGLKISTLPVAALGVGIGVDYGIYIFSRLQSYLNDGMSLTDAYWHTLKVTGNAVLVTALTLAIGVSTWIFSALQFQADMGILLTFIFLANMLGAMLLLPSIAYFLMRPADRQ